MTTESFDRGRLSTRENAILGYAIEGMTDTQIAMAMEISQSTVNSYWVRIRGKLGQLSRTELVALALKREAEIERELAQAQLAELREAARSHARISEDYQKAETLRAALDAMPEAVFVCCQEGLVRYANTRLEAMFGFDEGELTDRPVATLLPSADRDRETLRIVEYMRDPHPLRIGIRSVAYAQRKNGSQFRAVLVLDARPTSTGPIATCVVRDFTSEIEFRREFALSRLHDPLEAHRP